MSAHDLNLLAAGAAAGAYVVLVVWVVVAFWDDLLPSRTPAQTED